jgi:hypothetical protein
MNCRQSRRRDRGRGVGQTLLLGVSLATMTACESLLEADIPHLLTDAAIQGPESAETQINSIIALFECGYTAFGLTALGPEDVMESVAGAGAQHHYQAAPSTGNCDGSSASTAYFDQLMGARAMVSNDPAKLVPTATGPANGVYDRINGEWQLGATGERLSAIAAIYMGASLTHFGEFLCEMAFDGSDMITPPEVLGLAEDWITDRALVHINTVGDFAMPNGASSSARLMALSIRSRIHWANRDYAAAAADAATVLAANPNFVAWITREAGETRRNKIYHSATAVGFSGGLGVNTWWNGAIRSPNPVTGQLWPTQIPFTGYLFLGIMPDGRTLEAGNLPVRYAQEIRDGQRNPIPLNNGAVPDTRVQHIYKGIQGPNPREVPNRYTADENDIPYMTWQELRLIQADYAFSQGNFPAVIDHINALRAFANLPQISGAYRASLTNATAVRHLLIEERRREFYAEGGRYWSTKIQNTDLLWFPRAQGSTTTGYNYAGVVRQHFPTDEFETNPYFIARGGLSARGTGCTTLPGSQAPVL